MTTKEIIEIIAEHSLTVRCLPHVVVSVFSYREGDEERVNKPSYDANNGGVKVELYNKPEINKIK